MRWLVSLLLLALLGLVQGLSSTGSRLLVVIEESSEKAKYSTFWSDLEGMSNISISPLKRPRVHAEQIFQIVVTSSHLSHQRMTNWPSSSMGSELTTISFCFPQNQKVHPSHATVDDCYLQDPGLGPALTPKLLLQFIKQNGNVLLTLSADSPTPTSISSLLLELDIHLPPDRDSLVVDHFNYDTASASEKHDVLLLPQGSRLRTDVKNYFGGDGIIAFPRAVAQELGNTSPLLAPILRAKSTAYSYNPKDEAEVVEDPFATGEQISLVSSMQARNSARFTVFGSAEALENKWFAGKVKNVDGKDSTTANREFAKQVTAWTFMELGVLKVGRVEHHLSSITGNAAGNDSVAQLGYLNPTIYRVKNDVVSVVLPQNASEHANCPRRRSISTSLSTLTTISVLSKSMLQMLCSLNLPCFRPIIVSILYPLLRHLIALSSAVPSDCRTSMVSSPSASTTSDLSSPMWT